MQEKLHFEKLTLNENANISVYEDAIDYVFDSPDIRNVAISGAYGAGKSSVLATYKKKHKDKKYIHISLAHFKEENDGKNDITESVLEGKILNQLIHQVPINNIPQTNFKVKQNITSKDIVKTTAMMLLLILFAMLVSFRTQWSNFVESLNPLFVKIFKFSTNQNFVLVFGIVAVAILSYFIYVLIKAQKNKRLFKRVNLQGNEIEIFEDKDESYFDKYLNEVLYLFENTDGDVIVFEDMDRFELNHIFERLREINTLVNIQLSKKNKVLRFFYLLRDDVFVSKDRTKFFDYIIPIIPVVDGTNSYDQFIEHLNNNNLVENFDENFLQGMSLYIDDMRLLKNICNEFLIYYNRLNTIELNYNKMFALIAYKNLFPRDFSDLQMGKGYVFSLFAHKDEFISLEKDRLKKQIEDKNIEIEKCQNELLEDEKELELVKQKKQEQANAYPYTQIKRKEFDDWVQNVYPVRQNAVKNKHDNMLPRLNQTLSDLNLKLSKLESTSLSEIITRENENEIFHIVSTNEIGDKKEFLEIKGSDYFYLLKYLIRNGYMDETYADYMTYFYENSLIRTDKIFLRSIRDKKAKEYTYKLKNCELIIKYLNIRDFDEIEILNFDLFSYLLKSKKNLEYLKSFINQLKNADNFDFINQYFSYNPNMEEYVSVLNKYWVEIFVDMIRNKTSSEQIRKYCIATIATSPDDVIKSMNSDKCLTEYISKSKDFLDVQNINIDRFLHVFEFLNIKFAYINYNSSNKEFVRQIYNNSMYDLNADNILLFLKIYYNADSENIKRKNYSIICSNKSEKIYEYINENINEYVQIVLDMTTNTIDDEENAIIEILNNEEVEESNKTKYIKLLSGTIADISDISFPELWKELLLNDKVEKSEINIYNYLMKFNEFDKAIVGYVNSFVNDVDMSKIELNKEERDKIFDLSLQAFDIENKQYKEILKSLNLVYRKGFSIENVPDEKMKILFEAGIIKMTKANLINIREYYPESVLTFIQVNVEEYAETIDAEIYSTEELMEILSWNIDDSIKIKLLENENGSISIQNTNYSKNLCYYILNNNFNKNDIDVLYEQYSGYDAKIQEFIFAYACNNIHTIVDNAKQISKDLACLILKNENLDETTRIEILTSLIPHISRETGKEYAKELNCNNYAAIFDSHKKPKYEINDINTNVLEAMVEAKWIYEYLEDENKQGFYKIHRNKPPQKKLEDILL